MSRTVAVIQARTGSTRLPGKVLKPLHDDVSLLAFQCRRLRAVPGVDELAIATTTTSEDEPLVKLGEAEGVRVVRGPEHDVLARFLDVADATGATTLVRLTSDSPFRDPGVIARCVAEHFARDAEYTRPRDGHLPKGLRAEVVQTGTLRRIADDPSTTARDREHVTLRIRENPAGFRVHTVDFPEDLHHPDIDLSVDTAADLDLVRSVHARLTERGWPIDTAHICRLIEETRMQPTSLSGLAS